jgi:hypothetical protein
MQSMTDTAEPPKPRGRWFQFRLRTLLLGVVLIGSACGNIAHKARIVAERKTWLAAHPQRMYDVTTALPDGRFGPPPKTTISRLRQWLGDHPCAFIIAYSINEKSDGKRLFPEAMIFRHDHRPSTQRLPTDIPPAT